MVGEQLSGRGAVGAELEVEPRAGVAGLDVDRAEAVGREVDAEPRHVLGASDLQLALGLGGEVAESTREARSLGLP